MKISVVVNTFNSERFLDRCLSSVDGFDEIVLCDMHSTDSTISIAERHGCRIVYHERTGFVEPARNYAISQAANEWVLVLDSDEVIPAALKDYLYRFAETARPGDTRRSKWRGRTTSWAVSCTATTPTISSV